MEVELIQLTFGLAGSADRWEMAEQWLPGSWSAGWTVEKAETLRPDCVCRMHRTE